MRASICAQSQLSVPPAPALISRKVSDPSASLKERSFDQVFFNPPFFDPEGGWRPPREDRRDAYWESAPLSDWLDFALKRLKPGGVLTLIHRPERLTDVLAGLEAGMRTVLVLTGKGRRTLDKGLPETLGPVDVYDSLAGFVDQFLKDPS